jgi:RimJ/RimL family protein N-acetyltransferase
MKYQSSFKNKQGDVFYLASMEDYTPSNSDIAAFTQVLGDQHVRQYITDEAVTKYNHPNIESLTQDILGHSALRWHENKEKRFLLRDNKNDPTGMIGVTLDGTQKGELWYYKTSSVAPFMQEAIIIALQFLKQENIKELTAYTELDNARSAQILAALDFSKEKTTDLITWYKKI